MTSDPQSERPDEPIVVVDDADSPESGGSGLRAYLQLVRAPAVFTALADVMLGFFFAYRPTLLAQYARDWEPPWGLLAVLMGASALLYMAGMVLNDFFDSEVDARERPQRPIPSGRVGRAAAGRLGTAMLIGGISLGWLASFQAGNWRAGLIASALAAAVLLYDGLLKQTAAGPLGMGACRMLNVLLGMAAGSSLFAPVYEEFSATHYVLAGGVGLYIVGVTVFARREAERSNLALLALGAAIMGGGIALVGWYPRWAAEAGIRLDESIRITGLPIALLGALILYRCVMAIVEGGHPVLVQRAVTHALRSLIVLDAFACAAAAGVAPALAILCLLAPTLILGWWLYST